MKRLFIASYFAKVAKGLAGFLERDPAGLRVAFIPTAANPEKIRFFVDSDRKALERLGLEVVMVDIASAGSSGIEEALGRCDLVFVAGGNTFYLLQELRHSGAGGLIAKAIANGTPYVGSSAGSIVLAKDIGYVRRMDDPAKAPSLADYAGLGIVDFYPLPHFGNAPFKKACAAIADEYRERLELRPLGNHQAILVRDDEVTAFEA